MSCQNQMSLNRGFTDSAAKGHVETISTWIRKRGTNEPWTTPNVRLYNPPSVARLHLAARDTGTSCRPRIRVLFRLYLKMRHGHVKSYKKNFYELLGCKNN